MLSGTRKVPPVACHPAPSQKTAAIAPGITWELISAKCSDMHSVLTAGVMIAAPTRRSGHIVPKM